MFKTVTGRRPHEVPGNIRSKLSPLYDVDVPYWRGTSTYKVFVECDSKVYNYISRLYGCVNNMNV